MVPRAATKRSPITNARLGNNLFLILLGILVTTLTVILCMMLAFYINLPAADIIPEEPEPEIVVEPEEPEEPEPPVIKTIDFQGVVDDWANSNRGTKGVYIYDLDLDKTVGAYNADATYDTASLYKLFVVYEGYRRVNSGIWNADDTVGQTGHNVIECLDLAIRESNSPCAETLWSWIGYEELDETIQNEFRITNSEISSLRSNAQDIAKMLRIYYTHKDVTKSELVSRMIDSFLNQPVTIYDWRMGLPRGFSDNVSVYNKVGWLYDGEKWKIYHDAAIVDFPEQNRRFIVVVMTYSMTPNQIRKLAESIENSFYEQFNS